MSKLNTLTGHAASGKHVREMCTPLKPHFYIAKLGYAGVYLFFLFLLQNIDCGYWLEPPRLQNIDCGYTLELPLQDDGLAAHKC